MIELCTLIYLTAEDGNNRGRRKKGDEKQQRDDSIPCLTIVELTRLTNMKNCISTGCRQEALTRLCAMLSKLSCYRACQGLSGKSTRSEEGQYIQHIILLGNYRFVLLVKSYQARSRPVSPRYCCVDVVLKGWHNNDICSLG